MSSPRAVVACSVLALALLGFFQFPGHTFLHQDTQIYIPMLERMWNHDVLARDLVATHPHVAFTLYDEIALGLRWITRLDFQYVLVLQQIPLRALGILGVYLIACALGLSMRMALLAAGVFSLGATIGGPSVLTFEYEPVPRGFAVPLVLLAIGLVAHRWFLAAGISAALGFLYHPPAVWPFWLIWLGALLWPGAEGRRSWWRGLLPLAAAALLLGAFAWIQREAQDAGLLWRTLEADLEKLQRMRAAYNWISAWSAQWIQHYELLGVIALGAFLRLRQRASRELSWFLIGLPLVGLASLPVSWWLLDDGKWALIPQVQPARSVLFLTVMGLVAASVAGLHAVGRGRLWEGAAWLMAPFAIPTQSQVIQVLLPDLRQPLPSRRVLLVAALVALAVLAAWLESRRRRGVTAVCVVTMLAASFLIPSWGKVRNYPRLDHPELAQLCDWARTKTPPNAVFLFPDAGKELHPGLFRGRALRAVYVDWKVGGQANFSRALAADWWSRWQRTMEAGFRPSDLGRYEGLGIDFLVVSPEHRIPARTTAFENGRYLVYVLGLRAGGR